MKIISMINRHSMSLISLLLAMALVVTNASAQECRMDPFEVQVTGPASVYWWGSTRTQGSSGFVFLESGSECFRLDTSDDSNETEEDEYQVRGYHNTTYTFQISMYDTVVVEYTDCISDSQRNTGDPSISTVPVCTTALGSGTYQDFQAFGHQATSTEMGYQTGSTATKFTDETQGDFNNVALVPGEPNFGYYLELQSKKFKYPETLVGSTLDGVIKNIDSDTIYNTAKQYCEDMNFGIHSAYSTTNKTGLGHWWDFTAWSDDDSWLGSNPYADHFDWITCN